MKKKNEKKEVVYSPITVLKNIVIFHILLIYFTLELGDIVRKLSDFGSFLTRYLPVGIVTLIFTYFYFKSNVSKCLLQDKEAVKKNVILGPIIVAIIIFGYGLYSVESNVGEVRDELKLIKIELEEYLEEFPEEKMDEYVVLFEESEKEFYKAINEARLNWFITSIIYLLVSEFVVHMMKNKFDEWLILEEETSEDLKNDVSTNELTVEEENTSETTLNNINWNL